MSSCPAHHHLEQILRADGPHTADEGLLTHVRACTHCQKLLERLSDSEILEAWKAEADSHPDMPDEHIASSQMLSRWFERSMRQQSTDTSLTSSGSLTANTAGREIFNAEAFAPYIVQAELGRGGMGIVFRARDPALNRTVAIKVLRPEMADERARSRFIQEAQAAARVNHDHLVRVYATANPPGGYPYLVMEYLAGPSLAELIRQPKGLPPAMAADLAAQVADGLAAAHDAGLVHRDIKPANIMLDVPGGRAKIMDFGLARSLEVASGLTQEGVLPGTPVYMSPEQARGNEALDRRTDVYSLGATFYEALTGQPPFRGTPHLVLAQVVRDDPPPPRVLAEGVPADLETICLKAMAKEPGRRYQTAGELADDLRRWQRGEPIKARPVGLWEGFWLWCRRRPMIVGLVFALALVLSAGFASVTYEWRQAEHQRVRAEDNFRQARDVVDALQTRVIEHPGLKAHDFEPLRRDLLRTARDFYERFILQEPDDPGLRADLGRAHGRLGAITMVLDSPPKGLEHYNKMQTIFARLHQEQPGNRDYQNQLAESYLQLAVAYRAMGRSSRAEDAYGQSRRLREDLVTADPNTPDWQYDLARTFKEAGTYYLFNANRYDLAEQVLNQARAICEHLRPEELQAASHYYVFGLILAYLGKLYGYTDRPVLQGEACTAAIVVFEPLARGHPENPEYAYSLADTLSELGDSHLRQGQPDLAQRVWERALAAAEELARRHGAVPYYRHTVADIRYNLGLLLYHERHRREEARAALRKALEIEEKLALEFPQVAEYRFYFANLLREFRDLFRDTATLHAVLGRITAAVDEREGRRQTDRDAVMSLGYLHECRAVVFQVLGQYAEAISDFEKGTPTSVLDDTLDLIQTLVLAQRKEYALAAAGATRRLERVPENETARYEAACIYTQLVAAARQDTSLSPEVQESLASKYSLRAVELLRQAWLGKYFSTPSTRHLLANDTTLNPLRTQPEFQALLAECQRKQHARKTPSE